MATNTTGTEELLGLDRETLVGMLRKMILGRRFEEKTAEMYQLGEIGGFCHLYIGQEAVGVGAISPLRPDDYVITAYRDHVQALVRGMDPKTIMAELLGRQNGSSGGKGGSMHLFAAKLNFMGGHAIVGGHVPLAVGIGYAIRYRDSDAVCLCLFGDSVANIGAFHESMNMAALWELPVVFVIENNRYGMGTDIHRSAAIDQLSARACGYQGLEGRTIDGMNVLEVRKAVQEAIDRARTEKKPTLIEALCYRYMGHSMSDPSYGIYRTKEDVQEHRKSDDPIKRFVEVLEKHDIVSEGDVQSIDAEAQKIVAEAVEFAQDSPRPEAKEIYTDIYAGDFRDLKRRDPWR